MNKEKLFEKILRESENRSKTDLEQVIHDYLKNNLSIAIHPYREDIEWHVYLGDEEISFGRDTNSAYYD